MQLSNYKVLLFQDVLWQVTLISKKYVPLRHNMKYLLCILDNLNSGYWLFLGKFYAKYDRMVKIFRFLFSYK